MARLFRKHPARRARVAALAPVLLLAIALVLSPTGAQAADQIHWTLLGQTSVAFSWRGTAGENTIQFGTSPGSYTGSVTAHTPAPLPTSSAGPFWEVTLSGLQQNALYYYRIGANAEHTFRTPPARGSAGFWVGEMADIGSSLAYATVVPTATMMAQDNPNIPGDDRPRFVLSPGDLTYGDDKGEAHCDQHFNDMMAWSQDAAYMVAWGNHEWDTSVGGDDLNNYEGRFVFPNTQTSPGASSAIGDGPADDWYWFDYGNTRFIAYPEPYSGAWSDWRTKTDAIMAAAQTDAAITFIITYGHRPPWSSGADHGGDATLAGYMAALKVKYSKYVMNIAGHSHHYERTNPAQTDGLLHIIGPGGGSSLGGLSTQPSWSVYRLDHLEHVRMHIQANRIDGYVVCGPAGAGNGDTCTQGTIVDQWSIVAGAPVADTTAPAAIRDLNSGP